jgi:uncharacterized protein (TIGR02680 family)
MNVNVPLWASLASKPALPVPARPRWQPLRIGLVDLFHYDSEEFWFRDGHLLLRGNNGTGKSKVLSLTLPFLFDAQTKSSRLEPDGDATKKMSWNLLLGRYERRMGYAWIEFGRLAEDGEPQYLTLGSGLSAVAARSHVDSWFFVLDGRRIGLDLWLTNPQRVVLTKERLKEALGEYGQVFETATTYRRVVDERLFQLGAVRYSALMDTLVQLRQPQLSKKPDEANLSNALTEALPPLSAELLGDVADALNQLEEDRRQLEEYEALARAVGQFNERYQFYAKTQTRRQARNLRSAQTGFDSASRALNEARAELERAQTAEARATEGQQNAASELRTSRTRLQVLQSDPANADANRLDLASKEAAGRRRDAEEAARADAEAKERLGRESQASRERDAHKGQAERAMAAIRKTALEPVRAAGIGEPWTRNLLCSGGYDDLTRLDPENLKIAENDLRQVLDQRREQTALMRQRRNDVDRAQQDHAAKNQARDERFEEASAAATRREAADDLVEREGRTLLDAWQDHFDSLRQLAVPDAQALTEAFALWVSNLQGENPARAALQTAQQLASERLARHHSEITAERAKVKTQKSDLEAERERLERGEERMPAEPPFRAPEARIGRPGAPLWQLVDFRDEIDEEQRAGLEAALEASGLLDAWVAPDGRVHTADGGQLILDTQLVQRPHRDATLAAWLQPSGSIVEHTIVAAVLRGMACTAADDGADDTWVSPDGSFRIGALAGAWAKPVATYIGYSARAAARARRLEAIALEIAKLTDALGKLEERFAEHARDQAQAAAEWRTAPGDDPLRKAHAEAASCAREYQAASGRLEQAEQQLASANQNLQVAHAVLARDAEDLHLPDTHQELDLVERALAQLGEHAIAIGHAADNLRRAHTELLQQRRREDEAHSDAERCAKTAAERRAQAAEARVQLETLQESVGAKVAEYQQRLETARASVTAGEDILQTKDKELRLTGETRARADQKASDAQIVLQERTASRQQAVARLQGFASTDLLSVALPEIDLPDLLVPWTIEPALTLARRSEQALSTTPDDDEAWKRVQSQLSQDYTDLSRALSALGHQAQMDQTADYGLVVTVVYQNRSERPDRLKFQLEAEIAQRRELLTAREREVLENHLQAEIAAAIQRLLQDAERQVDAINKELHKRPTSTGVRFRLQWQPLPEGTDGAPVGLDAARKKLLNTSSDLWTPEDRRVVGAMLQERIETERANADAASGGSLLDQLARALDYRRWHRFTVQRWQDGQWRKLSGPASSGERALGLTVPLFAAVASYYSQSGYPHSPRLVLLDEVFAGIDDAARAHCMGLIREFDLDFIVTSEREWGCYAELPGVSICQLQRHEGIDAVHVSRWTWDGHAKNRIDDPDRRFSDA